MLRISGRARSTMCQRRLVGGMVRMNSTATVGTRDTATEPALAEVAQQKLREKVMAEALAKEEQAMLKAKALRELKERTRLAVHALNNTPSQALEDRMLHLQSQLDLLPDQNNVKQLDEQIEDFLFESMRLPAAEVGYAPWTRSSENHKDGTGQVGSAPAQRIRTTSSGSIAHQFPNLQPTPDYKAYSEQELFLRHMAHVGHTGHLGTHQTQVYEPSEDTFNPRSVSELSIAQLMAAECHLGHAKALWRPSTQPFIYGEYQGVHLIDLNHTLVALRKAAKVTRAVAAKGGVILYVGTSRLKEQQVALEEAARRSNAYCVTHRWIPGTITNFTEVSRQILGPQKALVNLADEPTGKYFTTTEGTIIKPDLIVLMNPVENRNCIGESIKLRIPTIGLCDTNMEPTLLTYPVPCNDDSMRASSLILGVLLRAAQEGVQERKLAFAHYKQAQGASLAATKMEMEKKTGDAATESVATESVATESVATDVATSDRAPTAETEQAV
ncbi:hypothetical protein METBIDRAFT_29730 [Metschnikowia bicuspidata var. bicuspidata NRRL YB-4993]|uniref:Ribosomal protein S2 n=1 Tax=Metschnikowia bicuspidata var. bicuspidata NRRL YB-4993 TaxID=869754 RepID=A0A1A0HGT6_9ASCO|nr:hypothetical protein METBIDRAFT_29730 [Metschnikowia bicuspidata var. bicuspidata NRRL YB-4993]OBA23205.1 hypothetical protein METBIDRAFT_29730 [Metschnikowia bicuspidata var. bicuspidata NRRL YB-4993]